MPQNNKTLKKEIRTMIKELNKQTGAKLSFTSLYEELSSVMNVENQTMREQEFLGFFNNGLGQLSDKMLTKRSAIMSSPILREKYSDHPAIQYSITTANESMKRLTAKLMELIDPEAAQKHELSEKQLEAINEYERMAIRTRTYYDELPKCLQEWNHECYTKDIENIDSTFSAAEFSNGNYKFTGKATEPRDLKVAELYYKSKIVKEELGKHNFIWRWINYKKVGACNAFLAKAGETLTKFGFAENNEKGYERACQKAESLLMLVIMPPHDKDPKCVEGESPKVEKEKNNAVQEKPNEKDAMPNRELTDEEVRRRCEELQREAIVTMARVEAEYFANRGGELSPKATEKEKTNPVSKKI